MFLKIKIFEDSIIPSLYIIHLDCGESFYIPHQHHAL